MFILIYLAININFRSLSLLTADLHTPQSKPISGHAAEPHFPDFVLGKIAHE